MNDPTQILVPDSGKIWLAPVGTTAPTDSTTTPGTGWYDLGLIAGENIGILEQRVINETRAFGQVAPVRRKIRAKTLQVRAALLQHNTKNLKAAYGGGAVTVASGVAKFTPNSDRDIAEFAAIVDFADSDDYVRRYVIPKAAAATEAIDWSIPDGTEQALPLQLDALGGTDGVPLFYFYDSNSTALVAG